MPQAAGRPGAGTPTASPPGAVVIGGYVNGLGLVRALAACGIPTAVVTTRPFDIAHRSRRIVGHDSAPKLEDGPQRLVDLLEHRARDWAGWALYPTNDEALAALAQERERLSASYRLIAPEQGVARYLLDKSLMLDVARSVGADVPHSYGAAVGETAERDDLRFPVVVKPLVGYRFAARFGVKLFVAEDRERLRLCVARMASAGIAGQVIDLVPGDDSRIYAHCTYVDAGGEPTAGVTVRKLRQSPSLFGVARVAELTEQAPAMREATVEILRRIGLRGMAVAEFKQDARDGTLRFIEVNGRSVVYNELLRRGGLDLATLAWSDYVLGRREQVRPRAWPGVWVNLHADLLYWAFRRDERQLGLRDLLAPYVRPRIEAVWSATDPLPFVTQWSRTAREGAFAGARWVGARSHAPLRGS